jgi:uncharacterized membrane protein
MTNDEKKYFWMHGVSRDEVNRALADQGESLLYRQRSRRALVIFATLSMIALVTSALFSTGKTQSYVEGIAIALSIVLYFVIRKSCRLIAEAPAELLDERFLEIRNRTYYIAYQILVLAVGFAIGFAWVGNTFEEPILHGSQLTPLVIAFFMLGVLLPNMVLAWSLPSEDPQ